MALGDTKWIVRYQIFRQKEGEASHFQDFLVLVDPEEHVIDGLERIWAYQDPTITFEHACHHGVCGSCGMRVNGEEKLTCITKIQDVTFDGGTIKLEPLRNFSVISDLVVDMTPLYAVMELVGEKQIYTLTEAPLGKGIVKPSNNTSITSNITRLGDCIECGLCVSACPIVASDEEYLGPAALAAIHYQGKQGVEKLLSLLDSASGVWRCHSAFDCSAVCPAELDPSGRIMALRKEIISRRLGGG